MLKFKNADGVSSAYANGYEYHIRQEHKKYRLRIVKADGERAQCFDGEFADLVEFANAWHKGVANES